MVRPLPIPLSRLKLCVDEFVCSKTYKIYGLIETPLSLECLGQALISHYTKDEFTAQLSGLIFGAEDFAKAVGLTRSDTLTEMQYARQRIVTIAKAFNLQCIDLVTITPPLQKELRFYRYLQTSEIWIR